jgi:hypothetical protein
METAVLTQSVSRQLAAAVSNMGASDFDSLPTGLVLPVYYAIGRRYVMVFVITSRNFPCKYWDKMFPAP